MQLTHVLKLLGEHEASCYRVHFDRVKDGRVVSSDFFPDGTEDGFRSFGEAEVYAKKFTGRNSRGRFNNIRVVRDDESLSSIEGAWVYAYGRCSTDKQDQECEVQKAAMEPYIRSRLIPNGVQWDGQYYLDSAISSKVAFMSRPAGFEVNRRLRAGDHVVISKLDRGFRSFFDFCRTLEEWTKRGVFVHMLNLQVDTSSVMGRLVARIIAAVAEAERELISERTREHFRVMKIKNKNKNGPRCGNHPPMGFKRAGKGEGRRLDPDWDVLRAMKLIHTWRCEGYSLGDIVTRLRLAKIVQAKGKEWYKSRVHDAVKNYQRLLDDNDPAIAGFRIDQVKDAS